jgi:predicted nucleic acid-binding protein
MEARNEPLPISPLLRFELVHGIRREAFRNSIDRNTGLSLSVSVGIITAFEDDFELGRLRAVEIDLRSVIKLAEALSEGYATAQGHRAFDTLHVATALALGYSELLTFDQQQRSLAEAEGLSVPL